MSAEQHISTAIFIFIIVIGIAAILLFSNYRKTNSSIPLEEIKNIVSSKENFKMEDKFGIYNYLNKSIRLKILRPGFSTPITLGEISPRSKKSFSFKEIGKYLTRGNQIQIYTFDRNAPGTPEKFFSTYEMNVPEGETIKMLHIGMITSRWVGADADYNIGRPGMHAVQGMPWIKIHNFTDYPLEINENINISPGGTLRYAGRDFYGVRLGTVFEDKDGIFPTFILTIPCTDVYYGVVSDIQQPLFGGFQLTPVFNEDPDEPQFLLEEGYMGGPAYPKIPYGYLPIEGPNVPPLDRWGLPVSQFNLEHPVGPPVELDTYLKSQTS